MKTKAPYTRSDFCPTTSKSGTFRICPTVCTFHRTNFFGFHRTKSWVCERTNFWSRKVRWCKVRPCVQKTIGLWDKVKMRMLRSKEHPEASCLVKLAFVFENAHSSRGTFKNLKKQRRFSLYF